MTTNGQTRALSPINALKESIRALIFRDALPKHISEEKFKRVLLTAVTQNPALVDADRTSLFAACMKSAQDGLLPDGREAALVTFKTREGVKVQFMPMLGGLLKKIRNSGELSSITAQIVHANDKFRYWVDADGEHLDHEPLMFGERGAVLGVYALAKTKDGGVYIEVMTRQQVMAVKDVSRAKDSGPWAGAFEGEMWKKTAIRRLAKRLPMSTDMDEFVRQDDVMTDLDRAGPAGMPVEQEVDSESAAPPEPKASRVSQIVKNAPPAAAAPAAPAPAEPAPPAAPPSREPGEDDEDLPL